MSRHTQKERAGLYELTDAARAELVGSRYYNKDLAPTSLSQRTWNTYNISALWIGMSVCIPAFTMASGLVGLGLSPWLAVLNVALGNIIILIPIQLNSHAGTKYGIPFPVFARMTFGAIGAHIPSLSRAITACGWNAVQSWIGGGAMVSMIAAFAPGFGLLENAQLICFFVFIAFVCWITASGSGAIKLLQAIGAPVLIVLTLALFVWSIALAAGQGFSFSDVMQARTDDGLIAGNGGFLYIFLAGLTSNIAFWATMALNIPDFSRFASSQRCQFRGQLYGMPLAMAVCAFIGAFFAQSTKLANLDGTGRAIFDPTEAIHYIGSPAIAFIVGFGVVVATITTNIAANVVAPANGFSNISPRRIGYPLGVIISCAIAVAYRPWHIFSDAGAYIFDWLNVYGGILAPIAAIFIADYYIVKRRSVDILSLYRGSRGRYWYQGGWNLRAVAAWFCGFILPTLGSAFDPLAGNAFFHWVSANAYIFGFIVGLLAYLLLMRGETGSLFSEAEEDACTVRTV
ncbi:MAG: NCS1 family nucleobase:cation symporter-1 [Clostridiales Family XIII bacterium]|jgi:NCS1 family nucleobase:cation symporter-1|nr:NCS1 family nucleobase:cation symporter-1 [Clostridiales Family XIII bacterium]